MDRHAVNRDQRTAPAWSSGEIAKLYRGRQLWCTGFHHLQVWHNHGVSPPHREIERILRAFSGSPKHARPYVVATQDEIAWIS